MAAVEPVKVGQREKAPQLVGPKVRHVPNHLLRRVAVVNQQLHQS